jgi:hypothetical protein
LILIQAPLSDELWWQFLLLHNSQGSRMDRGLPRPSQGIWLCTPDYQLVVGLCIYDTDGPFIVAEHLVSNPAFKLRERFRAFDLALAILRGFATCRAKWIVAHPSRKGLARYLERRGFKSQNVGTLTSPPGAA